MSHTEDDWPAEWSDDKKIKSLSLDHLWVPSSGSVYFALEMLLFPMNWKERPRVVYLLITYQGASTSVTMRMTPWMPLSPIEQKKAFEDQSGRLNKILQSCKIFHFPKQDLYPSWPETVSLWSPSQYPFFFSQVVKLDHTLTFLYPV
jgi:hypothetical protein